MHTQAQQRSVLEHPWRIAALVAVVANVTFTYASELIAPHGESIADVSARYQNSFTPAAYAFSIWSVIYGATLAYAVAALLPAQLHVRLHDRVAPWLTLLCGLAVVWQLLFAGEHLGPSTLICLGMFTASAFAYSAVNQQLKLERLSGYWRVPFSLWLGWLGVASLANLSAAITAAGWDGMPVSQLVWAVLMLCVATAGALLVNLLFADIVVPLVVSWAATAIAVAHFDESALLGVVAVVVALKTGLWAASTLLLSAFPLPQRYRDIARHALRYDPQSPPRLFG